MPTKLPNKTDFCTSSFRWKLDIEWFDLTGLVALPRRRLARIELVDGGSSGHYNGFKVSIVSTTSGLIDSKVFRFDDYLDRSLEGRTDGRKDHGGTEPGKGTTFLVIAHTGWSWYIAVPKSTDAFVSAVERFVAAYR